MDDCCVEERGEGNSDHMPYYYYNHFDSEYHDDGACVYYYYYKVLEWIIKADAQRSNVGRLHPAHSQQFQWLDG